MSVETLTSFAKKNGFDAIKELGTWKDSVVYDLLQNNPKTMYDCPVFMIVKDNKPTIFFDQNYELLDRFYPEDK